MEFIVVFLIGFFSYWFISNEELLPKTNKICPSKEPIMMMVKYSDSHKLRKGIKEYSLIKIQEGYFEYAEVLETLSKKEMKNDKS